jgi:hypothetical protein
MDKLRELRDQSGRPGSANPEQRLSPDVLKALAASESNAAQIRALREEADLPPPAKQKLHDERQRILTPVMQKVGITSDVIERIKENNAQKAALIAEDLQVRTARWQDLVSQRRLPDLVFPAPRQTDSTFWWAITYANQAPDMTADFRSDGLYFFGGPKINTYDGEMHTSFGATAQFSLQPERIPSSASGWFVSAPHVELVGGVVAFAPDWDLIQGNGIAQCGLTLRQTVYQNAFGQNGPARVVVAESIVTEPWSIYLKNTGYSRHLDAPGSISVPAVTFQGSSFHPWEALWAEIEVRYDIYLNTEGALLWCDPDMIVRTFQWPLVAV